MAQDILGQDIRVGARVLWASSDKAAGFVDGGPMIVHAVNERRVTLRREGLRNASSVPCRCVVVVDRLLPPQPDEAA